jgi:hypothetical protein
MLIRTEGPGRFCEQLLNDRKQVEISSEALPFLAGTVRNMPPPQQMALSARVAKL